LQNYVTASAWGFTLFHIYNCLIQVLWLSRLRFLPDQQFQNIVECVSDPQTQGIIVIAGKLAEQVFIPLEQKVKIVDDLELWQDFNWQKPVSPSAKSQESINSSTYRDETR